MNNLISEDAVYYKIGSVELGIATTGRRTSNYFCWCEIYDEYEQLIKDHFLSDVFTGKWVKCEPIIKKWRKRCEKNKLTPFPVHHTQSETNNWDHNFEN